MAALFSVTAPLALRYPEDTRKVIAACLRRPPGLIWVDTIGQWSK